MLKTYKNGFIEIIKRNNLDPKIFQIVEGKKHGVGPIFDILLRNSQMFFRANQDPRSIHKFFNAIYTRFDLSYPTHEPDDLIKDWRYGINRIYKVFEGWIKDEVHPYLNEQLLPDLWEQLENERPLVTGSRLDEDETSPFSEDEKVQLRFATNEFKLLLTNKFKPSPPQAEVIEDRLNYLSESVDRLNRIDWRSVALQTVISISIALTLDSEQGRTLFELFKQVFSRVLYLLPGG